MKEHEHQCKCGSWFYNVELRMNFCGKPEWIPCCSDCGMVWEDRHK